MSKGSRVRELLEKLALEWISVDQALSGLAEIVMGEMINVRGMTCSETIDYIAKLFEAQQELCKCEPHFEMPQEIRCSRCHKILPKAKD